MSGESRHFLLNAHVAGRVRFTPNRQTAFPPPQFWKGGLACSRLSDLSSIQKDWLNCLRNYQSD